MIPRASVRTSAHRPRRWRRNSKTRQRRFGDLACKQEITRDAAGRIVQVAYQLPGQATFTTVVSNVTYYPFGPIHTIAYGNGARQHDYIWMDDLPVGVLSGTAGTLS